MSGTHHKTTAKRLLWIVLLALIVGSTGFILAPVKTVLAEEIVLNEPFDDTSQFTTSTPLFSDGRYDYFGLPDGLGGGDFGSGSAPTGLKPYTGFTGSFMSGMDLNVYGVALPITVTWTGMDISGLPGLQFTGDFAEYFDTPGDIDDVDFLLVEYQIDGGGWQKILQFSGADFSSTSGPYNGIFREDTDFDGAGDGTALDGTAQTFTKLIPETGSTLDLRLTVSVDSGDEDFAVDNFSVTGLSTILNEPFNDASQFTTSTPLFSDGYYDYFGLPDGLGGGNYGGDVAPTGLKSYTGFNGSFLAGMDLDAEGATLPFTLTWSGLDISGITDLQFTGDFAEYFDTPGDIDEVDFLLVEYQVDGGAWQKLLQFSGADYSSSSGPYNGIFREDTNFDGAGDGIALGNAAQTFTKTFGVSGSLLDLRFITSLDAGDEDFGADNFRIVETQPLALPNTQVAKNATPALAMDGELVTYTILLSNSGGLDDVVMLTDTLPSEVAFSHWIDQDNAIQAGNAITWTGILTASHTVTLTFAVTNTTAATGPVTNTVYFNGTTSTGSDEAVFTVPVITPIHEIQGAGLASPELGNDHVIEGVVVGDFQENSELRGFFVQEEDTDIDADPMTSEGIFVYSTLPVAPDDTVRVQGTIDEYYGLTQLKDVTELVVVGNDGTQPTPADITLPISTTDYLERYEGMLVTFPQELYISEYFNFDRYGEIVLSTERQFQPTAVYEPGSPEAVALAQANLLSRILVDDGRTSQNPDPAIHPNGQEFTLDNLFRGGDIVQNVTGVLDYSYDLYRVQPTQGADYQAVNPRTLTPEDVGGDLQVASLNVLNYFTTIDTGAPICGPSGDMECRGADTAAEFTRQRDKIIAALAAIDADVIGLIEIENHSGDVPTADLVAGLNAMVGAGTYDYVATGALGTDAIRQALIYKPANVSLVGDYAVLDDPDFTNPLGYTDTLGNLIQLSRPALAQTFQDAETGSVFTVVVNHLKSKGSACGVGDDDPVQGNCNLTRSLGAQALIDWLETDPTDSGDTDFLIIGDLNAYDKEDPIDVLLAGGYQDLVHTSQGEYAYSYVFDGQLGYLDHSLASASLAGQITGATAWHINADEPDLIDYDMSYKKDAQDALYAPDPYRASDHDPIIVGLDFAPNISISKTVSPAAPNLNEVVTYTIELANTGGFSDTVTLTDTLPAEVMFAHWVEQPVGAVLDQGQISWTGTLTEGHTFTFTFVVTNTVAQAEVTNTVYFSGTLKTGMDTAVFNAGGWKVLMPLIVRDATP